MTSNVLVVGGAGYIGSHMVKRLLQEDFTVTILDDFSTGYRDAILGGCVIEGSIGDTQLLDYLFSSQRFDAVFHFTSFIQVGESVQCPEKYYQNNFSNTLNLLAAMVRHNVQHFIFSSTAAVYANPKYVPIDENHPLMPVNPYGATKAMVEQVLLDFNKAYNLKFVSLRYFNACGADPDGELGEMHEPETHLIPLALQAVLGMRKALTVFGNDYSTPDGTCIRDYVHVYDLCDAHVLALRYLMKDGHKATFNLGNGSGFSVLEVLRTVEKVTGCSVPKVIGARRCGDPAILVADATLSKQILGWSPKFSELEVIVQYAWEWMLKQNKRSCSRLV